MYVRASLPVMIRIVRGDLALRAALEQERLDVAGPGRPRSRLAGWLDPSPLTPIRSQRVEDPALARSEDYRRARSRRKQAAYSKP